MKQELISIVVPCYNEQEALPLYYKAFDALRQKMQAAYPVEFELILVDDGSRD
ncbi:MAG: glycosyltransferase, partial [Faecalibacterium sp.]|nr:glycosyltransferase [Faecalibacterium sp.]